ncbi:hypothetical protein [Gordonia rhizosphera]|uniref:Transposase n=1 Tax=Gordonia rhizosphera NBRC 16068 TaxID=1108045 RepID=K6WLK8_9ACTN|nr:hypothetical protein [Gordonia rhizosphera]GAB93042.1 hypothetical protein GORHZ_203_00020 [Gordonia rhizosphera NBRC 16068]
MTQIGASLLEQLLGADGGYRGPRVDCGDGHSARFVGYRDKTITTVLGAITVRRGYYHCADCGHGVLPRDDELGVADASLSPGLRKITAVAAAAAPFAAASTLLAELESGWAPNVSNVPPKPTGPLPPTAKPANRPPSTAARSPSSHPPNSRCPTNSTSPSTAPASP